MALRLTAPVTTTSPAQLVSDAASRATALLRARDLAGFRATFREADAIEDVHRRYQLRSKLIETALAGAGAGGPRDAATLFLLAAEEAVAALEQEAREPVFLNYAGVALYELGALPAAEALFR